MRDSWRTFFRRLAATTVASGSMAWSSAMCYALQVAFDSADDLVYADGWQAGDNGGTNLGPWNFDGTYASAVQHAIDDGLKSATQTSTPFNDVGRAWTMFNPDGPAVFTPNPPEVMTDISRAGRSLPPLEVGQTLAVVIDHPMERRFFRGYNVKLNNVGENLCFGTSGDDAGGCTTGTIYPQGATGLKFKVERFEYENYGQWYDTTDFLGLYDVDDPGMGQVGTDAGVRLEFTLTSDTAYELTFTPLDNPGAAAMQSGSLDNPTATDPIDWIEFQFFNTDSDVYPTTACVLGSMGCTFGTALGNIRATDYYVRSIEITEPDPPGVSGDYNRNGKVDAADYTVWRDHLGQDYQLPNEIPDTTPGMVTPDDYTEWKNRFGDGMGSGSLGGGAAVPEPAAFVYLAAAFALLPRCRLPSGGAHGSEPDGNR